MVVGFLKVTEGTLLKVNPLEIVVIPEKTIGFALEELKVVGTVKVKSGVKVTVTGENKRMVELVNETPVVAF